MGSGAECIAEHHSDNVSRAATASMCRNLDSLTAKDSSFFIVFLGAQNPLTCCEGEHTGQGAQFLINLIGHAA